MNSLTATYQLKHLLACMDNTNIHSDITDELSLNTTDSDSDDSTHLLEVGTLNQNINDIRKEQDKLSIRFQNECDTEKIKCSLIYFTY